MKLFGADENEQCHVANASIKPCRWNCHLGYEVKSISLLKHLCHHLRKIKLFRCEAMSLRRMLCLLVPWFGLLLPDTNNAVDPRFKKNMYGKPQVTTIIWYYNLILEPDPELQRTEFIKLWTLKEAYVKALGKGFSAAPFNTFTIQSKVGEYSLCEELL